MEKFLQEKFLNKFKSKNFAFQKISQKFLSKYLTKPKARKIP